LVLYASQKILEILKLDQFPMPLLSYKEEKLSEKKANTHIKQRERLHELKIQYSHYIHVGVYYTNCCLYCVLCLICEL